ncbi:uncharacterized protein LOC143477499 [Brachyhypopomus gauderio]|uniref:uncharacterized protein LOC143477499 n=1 Tax=Brachyhypopomus gauderio TaxID=698409 RepID=UPI00404256F5
MCVCVCVCVSDLVECVLRCMQASRRLMVVLSGECVCEKSVSLLECRLCVYVHHTCHTPLVTVRRRALSAPCSELAELRKISTSVHWHGARSERTSSRFWKLLRLALPLRPLALGPRLIDSTSSHSDLATAAARHPHALNHAHRGAGSAHEPRQAGRDGTRRLRGGRGLGDKRRGCASKGRACAVCVSFQESRRIWDGVSIPQWNTHLQQPVSNGTLTYTTRALTLDPGNDLDSETRHNHCTCEQNNSNSTNSELQTTHC